MLFVHDRTAMRSATPQRLALRKKAQTGICAAPVMMSATPSPRTLSMTYFADLMYPPSDELPPAAAAWDEAFRG